MKKTLVIDGKRICFKGDSSVPGLYKDQLNRSFKKDLKELRKVIKYKIDPVSSPVKDLKKINFEKLFYLCWALAKNADETIPLPDEWEKQFKTFPVINVIAELSEALINSMDWRRRILWLK